MSHPLDGPRLKVRRAVEQINTLPALQEAYQRDSKHEVVRAEFNPKTGQYVYRARLAEQPPSEWGILIGEIAHNLRSALDGLVYQLAALNLGHTRTRRTQFPVFTRHYSIKLKGGSWLHGFEGKEWGSGRSMIATLSPKHQALIERLQPYKRSRGGKRSLLVLLTEINNTDKHNLILPGITYLSGYLMGVWVGNENDPRAMLPRRVRFGILKDRAKLFERPANMHVNTQLVPVVAFGNECLPVKGKGVIRTFRAIANEVSEIVEGFGPEFA